MRYFSTCFVRVSYAAMTTENHAHTWRGLTGVLTGRETDRRANHERSGLDATTLPFMARDCGAMNLGAAVYGQAWRDE
jgi:hypothetical protein